VTKTGFGLVIWFIDHLLVVAAINYHTVPNFHTTNHSALSMSQLQLIQRCRSFHCLQFTLAHALGFSVPTSRLLATDLNTDTITSNTYEVFWVSKLRTSRLAANRQSVWLGARPLETHDQRLFFQMNSCGNSPYVTSSLTRRRVCLNMLRFSSSVHFAHITCYWKFLLLHYTKVLCQYRLYRANHV
jgi:hypothetical protein